MPRPRTLRRWGLGLATGMALALATCVARAAEAHAELVRSVPESNAVLAQAPARIDLYFSESVDPAFSTIQVLNSSAAPVDHHDTRVDPADPIHLSVSLPALPNGVYTVSWRTLSAADGHVTFGTFPFTVGPAAVGQPAPNPAGQSPFQVPLASLMAKWLVYLAAAGLAGGPLFVVGVWRPVVERFQLSADQAAAPSVGWSRWSKVALTLFFVGLMVNWWSQAGQAAGGVLALPWEPAAGRMLVTTRLGTVWLVQAGLGLVLAGLWPVAGDYGSGRRWPAQAWVTLGVAAVLLLSLSLASHAAADRDPVVPVAADWIHLMAAAVWVGGLIYLVIGLRALRASAVTPGKRTGLAGRVTTRFSMLALTSVAVLTVTGVYSAYLRIGTLEALVSTPYGWALILKLVVAASMVALGAVNLLSVGPRLRNGGNSLTGDVPLLGRFQDLVTIEAMLGLILLETVSLLTLLPPAQLPQAGLTGSAQADDVWVKLAIIPGRVGVNTFHVELSVNGRPLSAQSVQLEFEPTAANLPTSLGQLTMNSPGNYDLVGGFLGFPDRWQVTVVVQRPGRFDAAVEFDYAVGVAATATPFPWSRASGLAFLGLAPAYLFAAKRLTPSRRQLVWAGLVPAAALVLAAAIAFAAH